MLSCSDSDFGCPRAEVRRSEKILQKVSDILQNDLPRGALLPRPPFFYENTYWSKLFFGGMGRQKVFGYRTDKKGLTAPAVSPEKFRLF